jgi:hypothetical protein
MSVMTVVLATALRRSDAYSDNSRDGPGLSRASRLPAELKLSSTGPASSTRAPVGHRKPGRGFGTFWSLDQYVP